MSHPVREGRRVIDGSREQGCFLDHFVREEISVINGSRAMEGFE